MTDKNTQQADKRELFQEYYREIRKRYVTKDFTELSLRTPLENLIKELKKDYSVIQEPKRIKGVGAPDFKAFMRKVYINKSQFFEGISSKAWNFQIGAYRVLDKWLKSRKGRIMTMDEIERYIQIVVAIDKTIELTEQIDKIKILD